jgi:hypothetical protein
MIVFMTNTPTNGSDEREFLHNIATPIASAYLIIDMIMDHMQNSPGADPELVDLALTAFRAIDEVRQKLHDRRQVLIDRGVPSARS